LHLAWQALTDKAVAKDLGLEADFNDKDKDLGLEADFNDKDIDDRISGWLKAGPMDAQLAYLLDSLGGQYKTKKALLEAIPTNPDLVTRGKSCISGSYNRLIDGLNHIHPDVVLALGQGNKKNIELMARIHFLRSQAVKFLSEKYEEDADLFDDIENLTQKTRQHLSGCFDTEVKENYPDLSPETVTREMEQYFQAYFEEDTNKATPIRPVQDYIHDWEAGLLKDLETWIDANPTPTFEMTLKGLEDHTNNLVSGKLVALGQPIADNTIFIKS